MRKDLFSKQMHDLFLIQNGYVQRTITEGAFRIPKERFVYIGKNYYFYISTGN